MNFEEEVRTNLFAYIEASEKRLRETACYAFVAGVCLGLFIGLMV